MKQGQTKLPPPRKPYVEEEIMDNPERIVPDLYRAYLSGFLGEATGENLITTLAITLGISDRENKLPPCSVQELLEKLKDKLRFPWEKC